MTNSRQLFSVQCRNCGSPVGYDIPSQSYRCVNCGTVHDPEEAASAWKISGFTEDSDMQVYPETVTCQSCGGEAVFDRKKKQYVCPYCASITDSVQVNEIVWRKLHTDHWQTVERNEVLAECPQCGAKVIFRRGEASETCAFCGSNLVEGSLASQEQLPEFIIPFTLTKEQAEEKLKDWAEHQGKGKDSRRVKQNLKNLQGYYLPYRMIRGPLEGRAYRDTMSKEYYYRGFLDYALVNSSKQMDNQVLDALEPFDLSGLKQFRPEYIGGQRVKLADISDGEVQNRTKKESEDKYRPYVAKVLHNHDAEVVIDHSDFMQIPVLLPVYVQTAGKYLAAVNGQTGKVAAASSAPVRESKLWLVEPTVLTLLAILAAGYFYAFDLYAMLLFGTIAGLVFFTAFGQDRNGVLIRKIYHSSDSDAETDEQEAAANAFPSTPVFYEKDKNRLVRVEMKFYTPARILEILLRIVVMIALPAIAAALLCLIRGGSMEEVTALPYAYGAAWYVMTGGIAIIYWIRGVRWDIFNHPVLYEVTKKGERKRIGTGKSRRLSVLSVMGINDIKDIKALGIPGIAAVLFLIFLFLGSTLAILM